MHFMFSNKKRKGIYRPDDQIEDSVLVKIIAQIISLTTIHLISNAVWHHQATFSLNLLLILSHWKHENYIYVKGEYQSTLQKIKHYLRH